VTLTGAYFINATESLRCRFGVEIVRAEFISDSQIVCVTPGSGGILGAVPGKLSVFVFVYVCVYVCICVYMCMYVCVCVCVFMCKTYDCCVTPGSGGSLGAVPGKLFVMLFVSFCYVLHLHRCCSHETHFT
jgi:hypothetical protein